MTQPLKPRQLDILLLLYRFRFLSRIHIQHLLNHNHHSRIALWLTTLTELKYINRTYNKQITSNPAIYSLGTLGRKYLKKQNKSQIKAAVLSRVWREGKFSEEFKEKCLSLADTYISLLGFAKDTKSTLHFTTKAELHGLEHLISPAPDAYVAIEKEGFTERYFLEIFSNVPPKVMRMRVKQYFSYFQSDEWQDHTDKPFPSILLVCSNERLKKHILLYIQTLMKEESDICFLVSTQERIQNKGMRDEAPQKVNLKE